MASESVPSVPSGLGASFLLALALAIAGGAADAAQSPPSPAPTPSPAAAGDLATLSLEELASLDVTSASRKEQPLADVPAAIEVVTREDIRRAGVTSLAEALRLAAGMEVAQINASQWAISARGFNGRFANKLLVLIDGRSVYTPLFSGVYWEVQDTFLEDVERIEVIRGPGAVVWGANAVNGVVNVITRSARETQGGIVKLSAGSEDRAGAGVRYGGRLGARGHFRAWAKYVERDEGGDTAELPAFDDWRTVRGGARADWDLSRHGRLSVQGELYEGRLGEHTVLAMLTPPFASVSRGDAEVSGGHLALRWRPGRARADRGLAVQAYYDRTHRFDAVHREDRDTADLDFQQRLPLGRHDLVWGLGWRYTTDEVGPGRAAGTGTLPFGTLDPIERGDHLWSGFLQDEVPFAGDRARLTLGAKVEHNAYTGFELQPNLRLLVRPHERHTAWASVSRAVRTPARFEHDIVANVQAQPDPRGVVALVTLRGNPAFESERLLAWEAGYRARLGARLSLDAAAFYDDYTALETFEQGPPELAFQPPPLHVVVPLVPANNLEGEAYGAEATVRFTPWPRWRLTGSGSLLRVRVRLREGTSLLEAPDTGGSSPRHRLLVRSSLDLPRSVSLDVSVDRVGALREPAVPAYTRVDVRAAFRPHADLEIAAGVRNLTDAAHLEFGAGFLTTPTPVQRGIYLKAAWHF